MRHTPHRRFGVTGRPSGVHSDVEGYRLKSATVVRSLAAAGLVLATGALATRSLLVGPSAARRAPIALEPAARVVPADVVVQRAGLVALRVSNVTGPVERREGEGGAWRTVQPGETIAPHESLRTGSGGMALLELQDHTTVWLWPESQVSADRLDDELARIGVAGGRLDLNVPRSETRTVEVSATDGGATAVTRGARFSIIVDGAHVATVATREGEVDVLSGSGRVRVPPGMQTRARPGEAPEVVVAIPSELLLEVDWPTTVVRARSTVVRGRAPTGVLVSVGSAQVVVAPDGTFEHEVPLREGENHIDVTADDVTGRHVVRASPPIHVDTRPPTVGTHGRWE